MTRLRGTRQAREAAALWLLTVASLARTGGAEDFVVTSPANDGNSTFRWAIEEANALSGPDRITFGLPAGEETIVVTERLPLIRDVVEIDGTTQPGYSRDNGPSVTVRGVDIKSNALTFQSETLGSRMIGVRLSNFDGYGVENYGEGNVFEDNEMDNVRVCYVINAAHVLVSNNVCGNSTGGVLVVNHNATIRGNKFGVSRTGDTVAPLARGNGVQVFQTGLSARIIDNIIAGCLTDRAIAVQGDYTTIQGNRIGTNGDGTVGLGNHDGIGLGFGTKGHLVGGPLPEHANVISANSLSGIGVAAEDCVVQGNFIGTDATGSFAIPNVLQGIQSLTPGQQFIGNVISGNNGRGLYCSSGAAVAIKGNNIGVGKDGVTPIPNQGAGVTLRLVAGVTVGGEVQGDANTIAHNAQEGVLLVGGQEAQILGNIIRDNGEGGIRHEVPLDGLQLDLINLAGTELSLVAQPASEGPHTVQVYTSDACDPKGGGERVEFTADLDLPRLGPNLLTVRLNTPVPDGKQLTATLTSNATTTPFSQCLLATRSTSACDLCACSKDPTDGNAVVVDCESRGLRSIPGDLPVRTSRLIMRHNTLTFMHLIDRNGTALAGLEELAHLDLRDAGLETLPAGLLEGLPMLATLLLSNNRLDDATMMLVKPQQLPSLTTLDLSNNLIRAVPRDFVAGSAVASLSLRNNLIDSLGTRALAAGGRLLSVDVAGNKVSSIDGSVFAGSINLQTVDLSSQDLVAANGDPVDLDAPLLTFAALPSLGAINWIATSCPAGFASGFESSGLLMCLRCPVGTHKPHGEGTLLACTPCPAGTTDHDADPVTPCKPCQGGRYTDPGSAGPCDEHQCPAGTTDADGQAATACVACEAGTFSPAGTVDACETCGVGTTDGDSDPSTPCIFCVNGTKAPQSGIGGCEALPAVAPPTEPSDFTVPIVLSVIFGLLLLLIFIGLLVFRNRSRREKREAARVVEALNERVQKQVIALGGLNPADAQQRLRAAEVPRSRVVLDPTRTLGEGEFGVVVLGKLVTPGRDDQVAAVKTLHSPDPTEQEEFLMEAKLTCILQHPRIVSVLATCTKETPFYAVLECMPGGDLRSFLRKAKPRTEPVLLINACWQVASALGFLKQKGVIHRDLAARNVLVGTSLENVKLSDFGMSKSLDEKTYYRKLDREKVPVKWLAPECLQKKIFTHESDIWSFGVLMWEVFTHGETPYAGMTGVETAMAVGIGTRLPKPQDCPSTLYKLMLRMWAFHANERVAVHEISDVLVHELMSDGAARRDSLNSRRGSTPLVSPRFIGPEGTFFRSDGTQISDGRRPRATDALSDAHPYENDGVRSLDGSEDRGPSHVYEYEDLCQVLDSIQETALEAPGPALQAPEVTNDAAPEYVYEEDVMERMQGDGVALQLPVKAGAEDGGSDPRKDGGSDPRAPKLAIAGDTRATDADAGYLDMSQPAVTSAYIFDLNESALSDMSLISSV